MTHRQQLMQNTESKPAMPTFPCWRLNLRADNTVRGNVRKDNASEYPFTANKTTSVLSLIEPWALEMRIAHT